MKRIAIETMAITIRQEMELNVIAHNCFLKNAVDKMSDITLLRNTHPLDLYEFAKQLYQQNQLSKEALKELVKEKEVY